MHFFIIINTVHGGSRWKLEECDVVEQALVVVLGVHYFGCGGHSDAVGLGGQAPVQRAHANQDRVSSEDYIFQ
jgi:hypothetical protein